MLVRGPHAHPKGWCGAVNPPAAEHQGAALRGARWQTRCPCHGDGAEDSADACLWRAALGAGEGQAKPRSLLGSPRGRR